MDKDLVYKIALTLVPNIGSIRAKYLLQYYEAREIFSARKGELEKLEGIGPLRAKYIKEFKQFDEAEAEIAFIEKYGITPLFIGEEKYPKRLLNCYDSPTMLYYKGNANLNEQKIVSIIGTRLHTEYGKSITQHFIEKLANYPITIVSGLAHGIDGIAHKFSLQNKLATIGVLAHGLHTIYPAQHNSLAKDMIAQNGGLLTEFTSKTKPDKHNFPTRNRIVAGMSDATVIVETDIRGGSMITAELANGYNKDVFAFPGRITDGKSAGCNFLIKSNKASLITSADDFLLQMGWEERPSKKKKHHQKELFLDLTSNEKIIIDLLKKKDATSIDDINFNSGLSSSGVAAALLNLEIQNVVTSLPGKFYSLG